MRVNKLWTLIFLLPFYALPAQVKDNFSDHNFNSAPRWAGDTSSFTVNDNLELQSKGPQTTTLIGLAVNSNRVVNTEWSFLIRLPFNPATSTFPRIYLASDTSDAKGTVKGYFVKIGGITGNKDAIDLYRQDGTKAQLLIAGIPGNAGRNNNKIRVKVTHDAAGQWKMYSDTSGGYTYTKEGACFDTTYRQSRFFNIVYKYSSTRAGKFFFDDLVIGPAPLSPLQITSLADSSVAIFFNRKLDLQKSPATDSFDLSTFGAPVSLSPLASCDSAIVLRFAAKLNDGNYTMRVSGIYDSEGSLIESCSIPFTIRRGKDYGAIVISEILADPYPSVGLPEEEFIEIFNTTSDTIDLNGYTLHTSAGTASLTSGRIDPGEYLILGGLSTASAYAVYGPVLALSKWPGLKNDGDKLELYDNFGHLMYRVNYSRNWYRNSNKDDGGWSLEITDPYFLCGDTINWKASGSSSGGTPGSGNVAGHNITDTIAPALVDISLEDSASVKLLFTEALDTNSISQISLTCSGKLTASSFKINELNPSELIVVFDAPVEEQKQYTVTVSGVKDCTGNTLYPFESAQFVRPGQAAKGDVLLSEVLFNPLPKGADFVELYNRTGRYLLLSNWAFASDPGSSAGDRRLSYQEDLVISPGEYYCFTTDANNVRNNYHSCSKANIIEVASLPPMNDDEGNIILLMDTLMLDRFDYNEDYHFGLLKSDEGVSLERISFSGATNDRNNWHSAAEAAGFATPGCENYQSVTTASDKQVSVSPKVITPDSDGENDFASINYNFLKPGYLANVSIYNSEGVTISHLTRNLLLGREGMLQWDGTSEQKKAAAGYYLIVMEIFDLEGNSQVFKETVVVAER